MQPFWPFPSNNIFSLFSAIALILLQIRAAISVPSTTDQRLDLPKADWVHYAEGNATALIAHALELAKLADLVTLEKVERIERMMNSSMQQNEQTLRKGTEALERLTAEEEMGLSKKTRETANWAERNHWKLSFWIFCFIFSICSFTKIPCFFTD